MMTDKIPLTPEAYEYLFEKYAFNIPLFAEDIFLSEGVDTWQASLWKNFYDPKKNIFYARPSGHGTGKSFLAAITMLHFLLFHPDVGVVCTANTRAQLLNKLGREIQVQLNKSLITDWFEPTATKIYRKNFDGKPDPTAFIEMATNNPSSVEAFSGLHAPAILFVADECSALDPGIHQAIMSSTPKNVEGAIRRVLYLGNPLRSSGIFYDVCNNPKISKYWDIANINALECRYSDKEYLNMLIDSYGMESNIVKTRVLGKFPSTGADALISSEAIDAAAQRMLEKIFYAMQPIIMGVDVARQGDDQSVITLRQGRKVHEQEAIDDNTVPSLARKVADIYQKTFPRPRLIVVDTVGIGSGVYDILKEWNLPVVEFVANAQASNATQFANLKAECYWKLKEWFEQEEPDVIQQPVLLDELRALTYDYDKKLRIQVVRKKDLKKEIGRSPDHADSLMMTFFDDELRLAARRGRNEARPIQRSKFPW